METTTIKISKATKMKLDKFKEHRNETYDDVVKKIVFIAEKVDDEPELSAKTLREIEAARERMRRGEFMTLEEVKKKLGL